MGYLDNTGLGHLWGKIKTALNSKQDTLVSGTNIKTVGNSSILGSGNISLPVIDQTYSSSSQNGMSGVAVSDALDTLAAVASSGDYNDLLNKPAIPPGAVVDTALSPTSSNPVENRVITNAMYQYRGEETSNLDNCSNIGIYYYGSSVTNIPVASAGGTLIVTPGPGNYLMQWSIPRDVNNASTIYFRQYTSNNAWTSWKAVAADGDYVPATGGTFTGNVTTNGWSKANEFRLDGGAGILTCENLTFDPTTWTLPDNSGTIALTSNLPAVEVASLTATSTSVATISGLACRRYGKVVTLVGYITAVNLTTTLTTLTTLPSGYRPTNAVAMSVYSTVTALSDSVGIVNTNGTVQIRLSSARTSGNIYIHAAWVLAA